MAPSSRDNVSTESDGPDAPTRSDDVETRARALLDRLTLEEKLSMMDGDAPFWPGLADMTGGGYADHPWVAGAVPRLGIPGIRFADGPRGVVLDGATTFPVTMARGAAWDVELEERVGEVIGRELRALGANFFGGVCINLLRHPAWGRAQETYGEDPFHLGELGAALARGVQKHAMACVKHFAVNSMENARFRLDVRITPRALHEMYLPHFKRVVDEGVAAVMSAYNSVNGEWCGQNANLLSDVLKVRWGFDGFVISDFIFGMRDAKKAALAGMDVEMPFSMLFHGDLKRLVESGEMPESRIDDAVRRILRKELALPDEHAYPKHLAGCEAHRAVSREAAEKSIVLLKNAGRLLPLIPSGRIAVIGRLADIPNLGDTASSSTRPSHVVTPLDGIRTLVGEGAEIRFEDGSDADRVHEAAASADAVVLVVGYTNEDEGEFLDTPTVRELAALFPQPAPEEETLAKSFMDGLSGSQVGSFPPGGDRDSLSLSEEDVALIRTVSRLNANVVVVVMGGSAIVMEEWRNFVPAILMLWYPGMEGGHALADILFGRVNPSGKLPLVIPKRAGDLPPFDKNANVFEYDLWHGYRELERNGIEPAFPFGYGLSYSTYRYADLVLGSRELGPDETLHVELAVSNEGPMAGEEIVQIYISPRGSMVERAPRELKDFARVALAAGEKKTIRFGIPVSRFAYFDEGRDEFVVEPVEYEIVAGAHSLDAGALTALFRVQKR